MHTKKKLVLASAIAGFLLAGINQVAEADIGDITATYYRNGQMLVDDHSAEFDVISSSGNPSFGDTTRIIRWSNGTVTRISQIDDKTYMGGYPARSYGVDYIGGRVDEAYCTENTVDEMVCYKFK